MTEPEPEPGAATARPGGARQSRFRARHCQWQVTGTEFEVTVDDSDNLELEARGPAACLSLGLGATGADLDSDSDGGLPGPGIAAGRRSPASRADWVQLGLGVPPAGRAGWEPHPPESVLRAAARARRQPGGRWAARAAATVTAGDHGRPSLTILSE